RARPFEADRPGPPARPRAARAVARQGETAQLAGADAPELLGQPQAPGLSLQYCSKRSAGLPWGGGASLSGVSAGASGVVLGPSSGRVSVAGSTVVVVGVVFST